MGATSRWPGIGRIHCGVTHESGGRGGGLYEGLYYYKCINITYRLHKYDVAVAWYYKNRCVEDGVERDGFKRRNILWLESEEAKDKWGVGDVVSKGELGLA